MERKNTVHMVYLKDLLFAALYRWKSILCAALALALILGGIKAATGFSSIKKAQSANPSGTTAMETYQKERDHLKQQVKILEKSISSQQTYVAESALMALDAYSFYEATLRLYVDTGFQILPETAYQNPDKTPAVLAAYSTELVRKDHLEKIGNLIGVDGQYVAELIPITVTSENNSLLVRVMFSTAEGAQSMADYLEQQMEATRQVIAKSLGEHTVSVTATPACLRLDAKLADTQKTAVDRIVSLETALQKAETKLEALTPPARIYTSAGSVVKDAVIFFVIGAILGVVVMVFFAFAAHIFGEKIYSAKLLTERTGVKILGCVTGNAVKTPLDRWLRKLEGRNIHPTEEQTLLLAANLRSRCADAAPLLAVCDGTNSCNALAEALQAALPQLQISPRGSLLTDPAAIDALPQSKAVLLIAQCNRTRYEDVEKQTKLIADCGKDLVGCILLDG